MSSNAKPLPIIQSLGPPPERHADRVVAEMMQALAKSRAHLFARILATIATSSDGSPRAQARMKVRIMKAGALSVCLEPGKRGRYAMTINDWTGWDQARDDEITAGDPIPEKPWLSCWLTLIRSEGRSPPTLQSVPILFITHHVLSRAAQRRGARTIPDLMAVSRTLWNAAVAPLTQAQAQGDIDSWLIVPPEGRRVQLQDGGTVVLQKHETRDALVAVPLF